MGEEQHSHSLFTRVWPTWVVARHLRPLPLFTLSFSLSLSLYQGGSSDSHSYSNQHSLMSQVLHLQPESGNPTLFYTLFCVDPSQAAPSPYSSLLTLGGVMSQVLHLQPGSGNLHQAAADWAGLGLHQPPAYRFYERRCAVFHR